MGLFNSIVSWVMKRRIDQIELFLKNPHDVQNDVFTNLIYSARDTDFGREHHFKDINSVEDFNKQVPIRAYEDLFPYIEQTMKGKQNILWPSTITWFAKSSGTTNARSKFIPVS